jgi:hypothetical protein
MFTIPVSGIERIALDAVSTLFAVAGLLNLSAPRRVRAIYRLWHYRPAFKFFAGGLQLLTALLLLVPQLRLWGVVLGGIIAFFSVVALLNHRQYVWSLPAMLLLVALIPAAMA